MTNSLKEIKYTNTHSQVQGLEYERFEFYSFTSISQNEILIM